jgi:hypothetical protein
MPDDEHQPTNLYARIGEFVAALGQFDFQLMMLISTLSKDPVLIDYANGWQFDQRSKLLEKLMVARGLPVALAEEYRQIWKEMKPIMEHRSIIAHNPIIEPHGLPPSVMKSRDLFRPSEPGMGTGARAGIPSHTLEEIESDVRGAWSLCARMTTLMSELVKQRSR